ncbi:pyruvate dehydrogenase complex dihydrolipoamide acetyltransferase [Acetobacter ascendens]|uniref:Acetyltransferase component of pyruvate dehydrogenase complex n=1 Tax=Acetobacter ascendens TaxID=481146 RepID=A0A1D8QUS9_9PROT|nr:pyruvate dehydrogenase complex dihydrolipoamide acetyltransferase [Acetobacter ascendens]AOW46088.1 pyruvate dehydrogenase complex dihydrolipoamide acetyltransferase [Acetobacter ascendens]AOW49887.1 pyruvate dehydrogenase complex dihydrolipoamide acetyltransferase [Acetobacter ascendens]
MATEILMPALSPTMTEGKLARWLKKEGDAVNSGDVLAEIETDKATMEVEAIEEGILGRILTPEGAEGVAVNTPIAILVEEGEAVPDNIDTPKNVASASPATAPQAAAASAPVAMQAAPAQRAGKPPVGRVVASPLARRIAHQKNIDLAAVKGTGPNGRIVKRDVEAALNKAPSAGQVASAMPTSGGSSAVPHTTMRKVIARRLSESKATIPHFYVSIDVELDALLALRAQLNAMSPAEGADAFKLSVNDMLIKASAVALKQVPEVNASYTEDAMILHEDADISVAVSLDDGLITPIVRQADRKSLKDISQQAKDLIARARAGKLKPEEFQGGTFSISNMGMYGVKDFAAIVNPPQAAILAIAAGKKQAVVKENELAIATVMTVTLSVDHRVVDGAAAARWLSAFRAAVESPLSLVL